jgi:hypothetical protein
VRLIAAIAWAVSLLCLGEAQSYPQKRITVINGGDSFEKSGRTADSNANARNTSAAAARYSTDTFVDLYPQNDGMEIAVLRLARDCCGPPPSYYGKILALDDAPARGASGATTKSAPPRENNAGVANAGAVHFGGLSGPGPLGEEVASTFRDGSYTQVTLNEEITLYRVYGGKAEPLGSPPSSQKNVRDLHSLDSRHEHRPSPPGAG